MSDIVERLEALKFGLHWPEVRNAIKEITSLRARLDQAEKERDELHSENGRLIDENCDLRNEPWPEWAGAVLKVIRLRSGYDGYDDATDGVDLPEELGDCFSELEREAEEAKDRAEAAEASLAKAVEVIAKQREILQPLSGAIFNDNGDMGFTPPRAPTEEQCIAAYFADREAAGFIKAHKT